MLIFLKMDSFSNTLNRFKSLNFAIVRGPSPSGPPAGGGVIAFWWPGVPPPPNQNPPYASGHPLEIESFPQKC